MLATLEVRWFFADQPIDVADFFAGTSPTEQRVDWYAFPCDVRSGVKLRDGRLEAKLRHMHWGKRHWCDGRLNGQLESWRKWSLSFAIGDEPSGADLRGGGWVPIGKTRYHRHFHRATHGMIEIDTRPHVGCEFELTKLDVTDSIWWTVGFEAVGDCDHEESLRETVELVFRNSPVRFELTESYSYPAFLLNTLPNSEPTAFRP